MYISLVFWYIVDVEMFVEDLILLFSKVVLIGKIKFIIYFNLSVYKYRVGIYFIDYIILKLYFNKVLFGLKIKKI